MDQDKNIDHKSVIDTLKQRCAEQSQRFRLGQQKDAPDCFELFRLAICKRNDDAWEVIYGQYKSQVEKWVIFKLRFRASDADIEDMVNESFTKMWRALTLEKFANFSDIQAILAYLRTCVYSVIIDRNRLREPPSQYLPDESPSWGYDPALSPEASVIYHEKRKAILAWVYERVSDEKERLVLYGSYELDLKPQVLYKKFPDKFRSVAEIYTIKQNVLARLLRDLGGRKFFDQDA